MTDNQHITLRKDIVKFKKLILEVYGVKLQIYGTGTTNYSIPSLNLVSDATIEVMKNAYPALIYKDLKSRYRGRHYVMFRKLYCYIAYNLGYTCAAVGNHVDRDHSSVIHSRKSVEDMLYIQDKEYTENLKLINNIIEKHVGNISEDNKREDYTQSDAVAIQHEGEDISSHTEVS